MRWANFSQLTASCNTKIYGQRHRRTYTTLMRKSCGYLLSFSSNTIAATERAWNWIIRSWYVEHFWWAWNYETNYDLPIVERSRKATGRKKKFKSFRHCGERRERETRARAHARSKITLLVYTKQSCGKPLPGETLASAHARQPKVIVSVLRRNSPLFSVSIVYGKHMDALGLHLSHRFGVLRLCLYVCVCVVVHGQITVRCSQLTE